MTVGTFVVGHHAVMLQALQAPSGPSPSSNSSSTLITHLLLLMEAGRPLPGLRCRLMELMQHQEQRLVSQWLQRQR